MMKLTDNEKEIFYAVKRSGAWLDSGFCWATNLEDYIWIDSKVARGSLSSLIKKGYIFKHKGDDWFEINEEYLNEVIELTKDVE